MKRFVSLATAALAIVALVIGCGSSRTDLSDTTDAGPTTCADKAACSTEDDLCELKGACPDGTPITDSNCTCTSGAWACSKVSYFADPCREHKGDAGPTINDGSAG